MVDLTDILSDLRAACDKAGGVEAWANRHRIYSLVVQQVLDGAEPSAAILGALGYQSRTSYVRTK